MDLLSKILPSSMATRNWINVPEEQSNLMRRRRQKRGSGGLTKTGEAYCPGARRRKTSRGDPRRIQRFFCFGRTLTAGDTVASSCVRLLEPGGGGEGGAGEDIISRVTAARPAGGAAFVRPAREGDRWCQAARLGRGRSPPGKRTARPQWRSTVDQSPPNLFTPEDETEK